MKGKSKLILCLQLLLLLLISCGNPTNKLRTEIPDLASCEGEIIIRKWRLLGPFYTNFGTMPSPFDFNHLEKWKREESEIDFKTFLSLRDPDTTRLRPDTLVVKNIDYTMSRSPILFNEIFHTHAPGSTYAACILSSETEQHAVLLVGSDDGPKMWVNNKLCLSESKSRGLKRNNNLVKITLKKGDNFVLVKVNNAWYGSSALFVSVCSLPYAKEYFYFNHAYNNFLENPILSVADSLKVKLDSSFVDVRKKTPVTIINGTDRKTLNLTVGPGNWRIPVRNLKSGLYQCRMNVEGESFEEKFIVGDHNDFFDKIKREIVPLAKTDRDKINIQTLLDRFQYLEDFGAKYGIDRNLKRKEVSIIYELSSMLEKLLQNRDDIYAHEKGWHLRTFRSAIDSVVDHYMIYVPESYNKNKANSLVLSIPWAGIRNDPYPFSFVVADLERNEMLCRLAEKNGFIIAWPSARITDKYNLNPIMSAAINEALTDIKNTYVIDTDRTYLYGACSGGLFALLVANRQPSAFAAVSIEGPELQHITCDQYCSYPNAWIKNNSFFNFTENFSNTPIFIAHSKDDEKADFNYSKQLVTAVLNNNKNVLLDSLDDVGKSLQFDLYPAEEIMYKTFNFFNQFKRQPSPATVLFATAQHKYNNAFWVTVDKLKASQRGFIKASASGNTINITTSGIERYSLDLPQVPAVNLKKQVTVITDGKISYQGIPHESALRISLSKSYAESISKNHFTEGPINDFFKDRFIVVQGTRASANENKAIDAIVRSFVKNWKDNYFGECLTKKDVAIRENDILNSNLILVGTFETNSVLEKLSSKIPVKIDSHAVVIGDKKYDGDNLAYTVIYPNPINPDKYILLLGCNKKTSTYAEPDLPLTGWFDYQIRNLNDNTVSNGAFNDDWK